MKRSEGPAMEIIAGFSAVSELRCPDNSRRKGFVSESATDRLRLGIGMG